MQVNNRKVLLQSIISLFATKKVFIIIIIIQILLFISFYYLQLPLDFNSLSRVLDAFIRALSTMLVLVVSFIILIIRNELRDLPSYPEQIEQQLVKLDKLLKRISERMKNEQISEIKDDQKKYNEIYDDINNDNDKSIVIPLSNIRATDVMLKMIELVVKEANIIIENMNNKKIIEKTEDNIKIKSSIDRIHNNINSICKKLVHDCEFVQALYKRNRHLFSLIILDTDKYLRKIRQNRYYYNFYSNYKRDTLISDTKIIENDDDKYNKNNQSNKKQQQQLLESFYDLIKDFNSTRNLCTKVCIRHHLSYLAFEILIFTIPIIAFSAIMALSKIYLEQYDLHILNLIYALTMSIVILPFEIFLFRSLVVLYLIMSQIARPFSNH